VRPANAGTAGTTVLAPTVAPAAPIPGTPGVLGASPEAIPRRAPAAPPAAGTSRARPATLQGETDRGRPVTTPNAETGRVRPATAADVPTMQALINGFAAQNRMLFRSAAELTQYLDEYLVYDLGGRVAGVCGLHPVAGGLAEVRGLAVVEDNGRRGIGRELVTGCVERARTLGTSKVYTLTLVPGFFQRLGFIQVDKSTLNLKVWYECYRCPKFANCDEIAMVRPLDLESPAAGRAVSRGDNRLESAS
jgi:amino-acid N-acetyltransferase